jgi:hypothetical protein
MLLDVSVTTAAQLIRITMGILTVGHFLRHVIVHENNRMSAIFRWLNHPLELFFEAIH